ncbi:GNAT family N-acetyltransferase [Ensifer soli]|uniref:GNAT family N-acetyltransferase n=1 Tax=Ciceribacter sp. sgz301302 TaxID=3342379 RepID=UPI0035B8C7B7
MRHVLDRPAWSALTGRHAALAEGGERARRYDPAIVPFAAARDDTPESIAALASLPRGDEGLVFLQAGPVPLPDGLVAEIEADGVQMSAAVPLPRIADPRIARLGPEDAADMLELALLTKPGPFTLRAQALGPFWGIRIDGRLAAMAGTRMRMEGHTELSGVCTHPELRGRGLGTLMSRFVAGEIAATGDIAFLHAFASNRAAIDLYAGLGFTLRSEMSIRFVRRRG